MKLNIFTLNYITSNVILLSLMALDEEAFVSIFITLLPLYYFSYTIFIIINAWKNRKNNENKYTSKYIFFIPMGIVTSYIFVSYLLSQYNLLDDMIKYKIHEFHFCKEKNCKRYETLKLKNTFTKKYRIVITEHCVRILSMPYALIKIEHKLGCKFQ